MNKTNGDPPQDEQFHDHLMRTDGSRTAANLISKKELLVKYGISYGALYRWKRMGLIPEDWFIKQATVTGQETFLPEAAVCERIELILSRESNKSLEALADELNGKSEREATLTVNTPYGRKTFRLSEIISIELDDGNTVTDITHMIHS